MNYFPRFLESPLKATIEEKTQHKNVLVLSGARQVGKSTLISHLLQEKPFLLLHLEKNPSIAAQIDRCENFEDFENYLQGEHQFNPTQKILVIDEAQVSQKLGSFVRFMKEEWKEATVILTGSLINELYRETPRRPVGRETYFTLWPLTFKEFLKAMDQDSLVETMEKFHAGNTLSTISHERFAKYFDLYLNVGGLPEVVRAYKDQKDYRKVRADIYKTYEDDFVRYFSIDDVNLFRRCLEAVASNVGSPSKDSHVVRVDSPGYKKVASIYARLEKWHLLIKCEQLGLQPEENKFSPKRYLYDVGILGDLRLKGIPTGSIRELSSSMTRTPMGGLIENAVALSLKTQFEDDIFGLKLSSRAEIDFGVKYKGLIYPVECKLSERFKENFLVSLKTYHTKMATNTPSFLLYGGLPLSKENIYVLPFYLADELKRLIQESQKNLGACRG
ncbi:MAG TPA: hypothetical protein DDW49_10490, partial [Deltaproteobacteria bacterium]|nr:hypothetical protein [Deltaproteobacteria bacterium]